jgi:hypothetical protein
LTGFHAHSGWYFRRNPDGSVTVHADDSCGEPRDVTFDPGTWASAVASVSYAGETGETYRAALSFHGEVGGYAQAIINSRPSTVPAGPLSYEQVCEFAGIDAARVPTVTFKRAGGAKPDGILAPGETMYAINGAIIGAMVTGNA